MKLIILGPPASGKGTQAEMLSEKLNIPTISAGQLLREEVKRKSEIGIEIEEKMKTGELMPNALVNNLIWTRLEKSDCENGFILDGFPRTRIQAKFLNEKTKIEKVILVNVSDEEVVKRLLGRRVCEKCGETFHIKFNPSKKENVCDKCGGALKQRDDDTEQAIKERLKIYHTETEEVIEYYKSENILSEVNGEQEIERVFESVLEMLET